MDIKEFLLELRALGVSFSVKQGKLRSLSEKGTLDLALQAKIREHKEAIIAFLSETFDGNAQHAPISILSRDQLLPASFSQQRLWFLDQIDTGSAFYNIPGAYRILGKLDHKAMQHALSGVVQRHESLRTRFSVVNDVLMQVIDAPFEISFPIIDFSKLPISEQETQVKVHVQRDAETPFDLATGPLIRPSLIRLSNDEHILLLTLHHIVSDAWSMGILIKEISLLYQAKVNAAPSPLPELQIQYADYAHWQRQYLSGEVLQQQLNYWLEQLTGAPELLTLPTDRPRPPVQTHRGDMFEFSISNSSATGLYDLGRETHTTLFMSLFAIFNLLLSRYSGQDAICIGTPIANRNRVEVEALIGFFVNTLVLHTQIDGDASFLEFLQRVRNTALGAYAHQDVPFEQLVSALNPARHISHSPLFQVMFVLQNAPSETLVLPGLSMQTLPMNSGIAKFDLTLNINEDSGRLTGAFEYNTDLFERSTIERMAQHFLALLDAVLEDPTSRLRELSMLSRQERQHMLVAWNDTATTYPKSETIQQLFEAQAAKNPHQIALIFEEFSTTYGELNRQANRLAHFLRHKGVGADTLVGICLERSPEMIVALLAILKAGGAYLPLDPAYPKQRLEYILADASPKLVLTQNHLKTFLPLDDELKLSLDHISKELIQFSDLNPDQHSCADNLAYAIYTSGSTGQPKGVIVSHRSVIRLVSNTNYFRLDAGNRVLFFAPIVFDASTFEIWGTLLNSAQLVIPRPGQFSAKQLGDVISASAIDTLWLSAALFNQMVDHQLQSLLSVRHILAGGEALSIAHVKKLLEAKDYDSTCHQLTNGYGPTESTTFASTCSISTETFAGNTIPIGKPIANTQLYVLDRHGDPVPVGVVGELYIAGDGLARGYLNRPDLTAERFIPSPHSSAPGERMYKTGDLVRYLRDGNIEYLGRIDDQVKIRGFRIELGEIEATLLRLPTVRDAVVLAREDIPGDKRLVAYLVAQDGVAEDELGAHALRQALSQSLPDYMLPAHFVIMNQLPLTPNGKVDRKALMPPDMSRSHIAYVAPGTPIEVTLAKIWATALKLDKVGVTDNFFELGGHSLLLVSVIESMRREGLHADIRSVFSAPTISSLSAALETSHEGTIGLVKVPPNGIPENCSAILSEMLPLVQLGTDEIAQITTVVPGGVENIQDIYPLAPLQEGILFHHMMGTQGDVYLLPLLLSFDTQDQLQGFLSALQRIIDRHDILRTAVLWEGLSEPVQVVLRQAAMPVEDISLECATGDLVTQLAYRYNSRHFRIDVRQAPLLRGIVAHDEQNDRYLLQILVHHLVADHTTMDILFGEIQMIGQGKAQHLPAALPFRNFVAQARLGISQEEHEVFFKKMLGDIDQPTAPFGYLNVQGDGAGIVQAKRRVDDDLAVRIRQCARKLGVSAASLMHLAWAQVLSRTSGQERVVFGTVLFGRMQGGAGADRVMGLFINTLPIRINIDQAGIADSVKETHRLLTELMHHEHASLALAQRCSGVQLPAPLFTSLLNYRHSQLSQTDTEAIWPGLQILAGEERTNYPFSLSVDDLGEGFFLTAQVDAGVAAHRICDYMHTALEHLVAALEQTPEAKVATLNILPSDERRKLLETWNATTADYPRTACIHQLFEAQTERTPDQLALVYEAQTLTYSELNQRANQLAHFLRKRGVRPDALVALCVERSLEMIIGILGIHKAGGAYVPLDPSYPRERLEYMLADASPMLLLTQNSLLGQLDIKAIPYFCIDTQWPEVYAESTNTPDNLSSPDHLAYVIYTSGSTGRPKGVLIEHENLVHSTWARLTYYPKHFTGFLLTASFAFDSSIASIFWTLTSGGKLVLVKPDQQSDYPALIKSIQENQISNLLLVPSLFKVINDKLWQPENDCLQAIILAGEQCPADVPDYYRKNSTQVLYNEYGPTEASVWSTVYRIEREDQQHFTSSIPIGKAITNTQLYVLDKNGNPVQVGVAGELHIAGDGLARGYLNRPDLTAERFIPNPYSSLPGERMYKTGDLVRYLADGNIEYLGRIDDQVKIRGFRIELGEIEATLLRLPALRDAVVLAREDIPGDKRLVAYLVAQDDVEETKVSAHTLREILLQTLPDYMVPAHFVTMDQLPLTPNGKINRKALPPPDMSRSDIGYVAPRTPIEETLSSIWANLLKLDKVGVTDNFFELGGHSLLLVSVVEHMRQAGLHADIRTVFSMPTISALSATLDGGNGGVAGWLTVPPNGIPENCSAILPDMLPLVRLSHDEITRIAAAIPGGARNIQDIYPLAPLQEGILFHHMMHLEGDAYLSSLSMSFNNHDGVQGFLNALQAVIDRHDILRTAVLWEGLSEPVQVVMRQAAMPVEDISLECATGDLVTQLAYRYNSRHFRIDVRQAPLLRGIVAHDEQNDRYLLQILVHHLVADHTTMDILFGEIQMIGQGKAQHLPAALPFRNFVAQARLGISQEEHEVFFKKMLGDIDQPTAPFGYLNVQGDGAGIVQAKRRVDDDLAVRIRQCARKLGVSAASLMHLAWAQVLSRTSGQERVVFGTVLFGRMQGGAGADRVMGLFINTLPIRINIDQAGVADSVKETHRLLTELLHHEHASLALAQRCSGVQSPAPLFTSLLNYRHSQLSQTDTEAIWPGLQILAGEERTNYPFSLSVDDLGEGFFLTAQVDAGVAAHRICDYMHTALEHMTNALEHAPASKIANIEVIPSKERRQLLDMWNGRRVEYPSDRCIHELFEDQVARTPEALAITHGQSSLTYGELNQKSNQLAHYLIASQGLERNGLVGIFLERSCEAIIAILAVLKAGGAYVPLDPAYPKERLHYMCADAQLTTIISQQHLVQDRAFDASHILCLDSEALQRDLSLQYQHNIKPSGQNHASKQLVYIIYTSGSTGRPKGVRAAHRSLVNRICWMERIFPASKNDVFSHKTTIAFVDHVAEIFQPLVVGRHLVIVDQDDVTDPYRLADVIKRERITRMTLVPSLLSVLLDCELTESLSSLRHVISSGEPLNLRLVNTFQAKLPHAQLLNLYGSTEIGADASYQLISHVPDNPTVLQYFAADNLRNDTPHLESPRHKQQNPRALKPQRTDEIAASFKDIGIPESPISLDHYLDQFHNNIAPDLINVSSERFIGHMTSKLPKFVSDIAGLITHLNQNVVKIETSMGMTFIERQVLASMHSLFYDFGSDFYQNFCQDPQHVFGVITSGGSIANVTALWYARNRSILGTGVSKEELTQHGAERSIAKLGYRRAVVLGTRLLHYSFKKVLSLFGIGLDGFIRIEQDDQQRMSISDLKRQIEACRKNGDLILAIVGLAGATETGTVDPLAQIAALARDYHIHLHVDAAWGGAFQFSPKHRHSLHGIEHADTITMCPHKQLFLPQGLSLCLFKDTLGANTISTHAEYQAKEGSYDLGQYTIEGSRPANALFLHAGLHLLAHSGYAWLIDHSMETSRQFVQLIKSSSSFELIGNIEPDLNIINYRYIPTSLRSTPPDALSTADHEAINQAVELIQNRQFMDKQSFVSKTMLLIPHICETPLSVFRVVLSNPLTTLADLKAVLNDQLRIANAYVEKDGHILGHEIISTGSGKPTDDAWLAPIGKPIDNTRIYILDPLQRLVPSGVVGELYVGGDCVALDYLNQPEQTLEKFTRDPFVTDSNGRMYKTGDLARWSADGILEYVGRIDHQIKIRGFRIELGEIENVLLSHESVREVAVAARPLSESHQRLIAYIVAESKDRLAGEDRVRLVDTLRTHANRHLPSYMVPAMFEFLAELPLTPNGKLDRKNLPTPGQELDSYDAYHAPIGELEERLAFIWQQLLQVPRVGRNDDFFELGGHSLLTMQLVEQVRKSGLDIAISVKSIFECKTIANLAKLPSQGLSTTNQALVLGSAPILPNHYSFFERLDLNHWNASILLEVLANYRPQVLHAALEHLLRHHDGLRRLWKNIDGTWIQTFQNPEELSPWWTEVELSDLEGQQLNATITSICDESQRSLDVSKVLFRAIHFDLGPNRNARLMLVIHHLLIDAYSYPILLQDLDRTCIDLQQGKTAKLPPKTLSVKELAEQLQSYAQSDDITRDVQYWRSCAWGKYTALPPELHIDQLLPDHGIGKPKTILNTLSNTETALLESIPRRYPGISLEDVTIAATVLAYEEWSGTAALCLNFTHHGRTFDFDSDIDLSRTVAWLQAYTNCMLDLTEVTSLSEAVYAIKQQRAQLRGREMSFGMLKNMHADPSIRDDMHRLPAYQLAFNFVPRQAHERGDIESDLYSSPRGFAAARESMGANEGPMSSKFIPFVKIYTDEDKLNISWTFCQCAYTPATFKQFADAHVRILRKILSEFSTRKIDVSTHEALIA